MKTKEEILKEKQQAMPTPELIEKCRKEISDLAQSYGKSHHMTIPPEITDTDMILSEAIRRLEAMEDYRNQPAVSREELRKEFQERFSADIRGDHTPDKIFTWAWQHLSTKTYTNEIADTFSMTKEQKDSMIETLSLTEEQRVRLDKLLRP